jgi:hypothetical protein
MLSVHFCKKVPGDDLPTRTKGGLTTSSHTIRYIKSTGIPYLQSLLLLITILSITVFGAWSNMSGGSAIRDFLFFRKIPEIPTEFYVMVASSVMMEFSFPSKTHWMPYVLTTAVLVGEHLGGYSECGRAPSELFIFGMRLDNPLAFISGSAIFGVNREEI